MENDLHTSLAAPSHHDLPLGSCSTDPTNSYRHPLQSHQEYHNVVDLSQVATNSTGATHGYCSPAYPSLTQQSALAVLQEYDNQIVLAWLTGLRFFRSYGQHCFQPGTLSARQLEAVSVLKDCPDALVISWLNLSRSDERLNEPQRLSVSSHPIYRNANAVLLPSAWHESSNTSRCSAGSLGALSPLYDGNTVPTTPTSSRSRETFFGLSRESSIDEAAQSATTGHSHWCFTCPNPRLITTCDGWKRHMKEHETSFCCMPNGPIEHTAEGTKCAFCGLRDPDTNHCDSHRAFPCANKSLDVRSYTRKPHFVSHLETHHNTDTAKLAKLWKITIEKKHFSCGFCITHFHSLIEQLNHIDICHYRRSRHIRDWDSNYVIRGLLLQPDVANSWRSILASHPGLTESLLRWDSSVTKDLQLRLEMGNEPPETLAKLAFDRSTHNVSLEDESEMVDPADLSLLDGVAEYRQVPETQAIAPLHFNSKQTSGVDEYTMNSSVPLTGQHQWPCSVPGCFLPAQDHIMPRSVVDNAGERTTTITQHPFLDYLDTSHRLNASDGNYRAQSGQVISNSWISYESHESVSITSNSVMMGEYWQITPTLSPKDSSSIASGQPRNLSQHGAGKIRSPYTNPTFSPASDRRIPPTKQKSGLITQSVSVGQPKKQPPRSKVKDHYDVNTKADTDLGSDILQRLMREEDNTRSEKRRR